MCPSLNLDLSTIYFTLYQEFWVFLRLKYAEVWLEPIVFHLSPTSSMQSGIYPKDTKYLLLRDIQQFQIKNIFTFSNYSENI